MIDTKEMRRLVGMGTSAIDVALTKAADEIDRLRAKVETIERLTQTETVDGPNGAALRLISIRAELGVAMSDPRLDALALTKRECQ